MPVLLVDFETRGTVELRRTGVYPYAKHHDTYIWCMGYVFDDEDPQIWIAGDPFPERVAEHVRNGGELRAWNAQFERVMWRDCLTRQVPDVPVPVLEQWHDLMAWACAMALPRALDYCAEVLRVKERKDMAGNKLSKQTAKPRRFTNSKPIWWDNAQGKLDRLYAYCVQDIRSEHAVGKCLNPLNAREREIYVLDQQINDRGIALDFTLAAAAKEVAEREVIKQNSRLAAATDGSVSKVTQVAKLKKWLREQGIEVPSLAQKAIEELLDPEVSELSPEVLDAIGARQEAAKSSVAKIDRMLDVVGRDNRLRGLHIYHGASTGRWAGALVQPHNFPRGLDMKEADREPYIQAVLAGDPKGLVTLQVLSDLLRNMLVAGDGLTLTAADFATIEVRVLGWLAGDAFLLQQFYEHRKLYHEMGAVIYGCKPEDIVKPSPEYQLAKNTVLGCGFQMGVDKFMTSTGADEETAEKAVHAYRNMYPAVPLFWRALNDAALSAVRHPKTVFRITNQMGKQLLSFIVRGGYLYCILPAGRALAYARPKIVMRPMPWDDDDLRPAVQIEAMDGYTHKWSTTALYGGLLAENTVSGVARDLLADAMLRLKAEGFNTVMSVHDEVVVEHKDEAEGSHILEVVKEVPAWAEGCPVDAEGWTGYRYRK